MRVADAMSCFIHTVEATAAIGGADGVTAALRDICRADGYHSRRLRVA